MTDEQISLMLRNSFRQALRNLDEPDHDPRIIASAQCQVCAMAMAEPFEIQPIADDKRGVA